MIRQLLELLPLASADTKELEGVQEYLATISDDLEDINFRIELNIKKQTKHESAHQQKRA